MQIGSSSYEYPCRKDYLKNCFEYHQFDWQIVKLIALVKIKRYLRSRGSKIDFSLKI